MLHVEYSIFSIIGVEMMQAFMDYSQYYFVPKVKRNLISFNLSSIRSHLGKAHPELVIAQGPVALPDIPIRFQLCHSALTQSKKSYYRSNLSPRDSS